MEEEKVLPVSVSHLGHHFYYVEVSEQHKLKMSILLDETLTILNHQFKEKPTQKQVKEQIKKMLITVAL